MSEDWTGTIIGAELVGNDKPDHPRLPLRPEGAGELMGVNAARQAPSLATVLDPPAVLNVPPEAPTEKKERLTGLGICTRCESNRIHYVLSKTLCPDCFDAETRDKRIAKDWKRLLAEIAEARKKLYDDFKRKRVPGEYPGVEIGTYVDLSHCFLYPERRAEYLAVISSVGSPEKLPGLQGLSLREDWLGLSEEALEHEARVIIKLERAGQFWLPMPITKSRKPRPSYYLSLFKL